MNINEIDRKWINIGAVVAIMMCLLITVAVWNIWTHPAPDERVIMNTTIDEMPTPDPTQVPTAEPSVERPVEAHNESNITIPDMIPVKTNCTIDEYNMSIDGEMIRITDENIHNALMNCSIEDMTFDEFKRHVRDEGIDGQKRL
jgi:hypothetical protein